MSPRSDHVGEEERCRLRHKRHKRHRLNRIEEKKVKKKKMKKKKSMRLEEDEANKSLYICSLNYHQGRQVSYDVRAINLSDLLSKPSSFDQPLQLHQAAYKSGSDLPGSVGCGVWGSQIVFVGGMKPSDPYTAGAGVLRSDSLVLHMGTYGLEINQKDKLKLFRKTLSPLQGAKFCPFIAEVCGKLYALSYRPVAEPNSFEVFDPKVGSWAVLPQPPFFVVRSRYHHNGVFSYAVTGTKMFVSHEKCPVFCFDVAHPDREWRLVPTMCRGGPFPFVDKALVLDLPGDEKKKIMFAYNHGPWRLGVYLMSLVENEESIRQIGNVRMPCLPLELGCAEGCEVVYIGGRKGCVVVSDLGLPVEDRPEYKAGTHKVWGAAIPFEFEVDMAKVERGKEDCFTLYFMPPCILNYHTNPSTYPFPETVGCFVL